MFKEVASKILSRLSDGYHQTNVNQTNPLNSPRSQPVKESAEQQQCRSDGFVIKKATPTRNTQLKRRRASRDGEEKDDYPSSAKRPRQFPRTVAGMSRESVRLQSQKPKKPQGNYPSTLSISSSFQTDLPSINGSTNDMEQLNDSFRSISCDAQRRMSLPAYLPNNSRSFVDSFDMSADPMPSFTDGQDWRREMEVTLPPAPHTYHTSEPYGITDAVEASCRLTHRNPAPFPTKGGHNAKKPRTLRLGASMITPYKPVNWKALFDFSLEESDGSDYLIPYTFPVPWEPLVIPRHIPSPTSSSSSFHRVRVVRRKSRSVIVPVNNAVSTVDVSSPKLPWYKSLDSLSLDQTYIISVVLLALKYRTKQSLIIPHEYADIVSEAVLSAIQRDPKFPATEFAKKIYFPCIQKYLKNSSSK